jgi:hypothetical protein
LDVHLKELQYASWTCLCPNLYRNECDMSVGSIEAEREHGPQCQGYTRPDCAPCPQTGGLERTKVFTFDGSHKQMLCGSCRSKLLNSAEAWSIEDTMDGFG